MMRRKAKNSEADQNRFNMNRIEASESGDGQWKLPFAKPLLYSPSIGRREVITTETLTAFIHQAMPDATVTVTDRTGTMDHLRVLVVSDAFIGKNLLDRHRLIYQALDVPLKDGRIHALELTARSKEES
jgi:stress-induced morphogen